MALRKKKLSCNKREFDPNGAVDQPRPEGFSLKKWEGREKGPGIGWSRAQRKFSGEANLYATCWFALTEVERSNNGK